MSSTGERVIKLGDASSHGEYCNDVGRVVSSVDMRRSGFGVVAEGGSMRRWRAKRSSSSSARRVIDVVTGRTAGMCAWIVSAGIVCTISWSGPERRGS